MTGRTKRLPVIFFGLLIEIDPEFDGFSFIASGKLLNWHGSSAQVHAH
jgi:hypothetical protein